MILIDITLTQKRRLLKRMILRRKIGSCDYSSSMTYLNSVIPISFNRGNQVNASAWNTNNEKMKIPKA